MYDVLYVTDPDHVKEDLPASYGGVTWMRFWPGGQVHTWWRSANEYASHPVSAADGDNFFYLGAGRYYLHGNKLIVEFVTPKNELFCPATYFRKEGYVNSDGSITIVIKDLGGPYFLKYCPKRVGDMQRQPDWTAD